MNSQEKEILDYLEKAYCGAKMMHDDSAMARIARAIHAFKYEDQIGLNRVVGSKVKIKSDLIPLQNYGGTSFEEEMDQYKGKEAVITGYFQEMDCPPAYSLDIDDSFWSWTEEMLEDAD